MSSREVVARLAREQEYFDRVYTKEAASDDLLLSEKYKRDYANPPADTIFAKRYFYHLLGPLAGKTILEIACGGGIDTCLAANYGATVHAYDISQAAITLTRLRAEANGVSDRIHLQVCGDIDQAFVGEKYDAIIGYGALHHLPLHGLPEKIHARLRIPGLAVFAEPVINSRSLDFVRRLIPYRPIEITEDEKPLDDQTIAEFAAPFDRLRRREFECVARLYKLFPSHRRLVRSVFWIDSWLMRIKHLRGLASLVVFALDRQK
jgi:2-polyprenyl-3-methyl-5-hydroxy-6-metoxy-1,4-benzoquinol methylase